MFHFTSIESDDRFQGFRVSWQRNVIDVYYAGKTHTTAFEEAVGHAYDMRDYLRTADKFMPLDDMAAGYSRLYLKAFEEYAQVRIAQEEQTQIHSFSTLDL